MSNANPWVLTAAWRVMPAADRWQTFQSQLTRTASTHSHPWAGRSRHSWRAPPVRASVVVSQAST